MKQFKTESKRLLDLMINSIYTNKEIFLRELISNASDALDKRHYLSLTDSQYTSSDPLSIHIEIDKKNKTISISDNGIGMNKEDLENNLGTIAHSGSNEFKEKLEENKEIDIIGQFGVGFYSAFMVAKEIIVESKKVNEDGYKWISNGQDGYSITNSNKESVGTKITLKIRDDSKDIKYSEYLESYKIESLVRKYSDYIRYPITMMIEKEVLKEGTNDQYETKSELKTLNTMVPLWRRNKKDISDQDYNDFYRKQFADWQDPADKLHYSLEGNVSYKALLFIPSKVPYNYYSKDYEAGLQLYSKGVFIMDHCKQLLPDYFHFVKGLIDSDDISLNISREILQQDTQLQTLNKSITKKVRNYLATMLVKEREKYEEIFKNFGSSLKYGCYQDYGSHKEELVDLLLFYSSFQDKYVTLKEYKERMKEDQQVIYYACGKSVETIKKSPQLEGLLDKGYEVLYLTEEVDEFAIMMMHDYDKKEFKSAQAASTEISQEDKDKLEQQNKDNEDLLKEMKEALGDKVSQVRLTNRLKDNPVCLVADEGISLEMEKYLSSLPIEEKSKAVKILEINPEHRLFKTLQKIYGENKELVKDYTCILYDQALLIEGFPIEDPIAYTNKIVELMNKANS